MRACSPALFTSPFSRGLSPPSLALAHRRDVCDVRRVRTWASRCYFQPMAFAMICARDAQFLVLESSDSGNTPFRCIVQNHTLHPFSFHPSNDSGPSIVAGLAIAFASLTTRRYRIRRECRVLMGAVSLACLVMGSESAEPWKPRPISRLSARIVKNGGGNMEVLRLFAVSQTKNDEMSLSFLRRSRNTSCNASQAFETATAWTTSSQHLRTTIFTRIQC
jgi:hypothetical protein